MHDHQRTETAKQVIRSLQQVRDGWPKFLIGTCSVFHLVAAFTLAFAPWSQIHSTGTAPVLELASRYVWAIAFAACGLAAASLLRWPHVVTQIVTWMVLFPLGGLWLTAFAVAVADGRGNALSVVIWLALYVPWGAAAVRLGLGKR